MTMLPTIDIGGGTLERATESALNTPGAYAFMRLDPDAKFPLLTREVELQPNLGHLNPFNAADQPLLFQKYKENALSLSTHIRRATAKDTAPPIVGDFESAGCAVDQLSDKTTVATYVDLNTWTLTADVVDSAAGVNTGGHILLVQLDSGIYYPVLLSSYVAASKTCQAAVDLPSVTSAGKIIQQVYNVRPRNRQVPTTKTLNWRLTTPGKHTTAPDLAWVFGGGAVGKIEPFKIAPAEPCKFQFSYHVADIEIAAHTMAAETFVENLTHQYANNHAGNFEFLFADANSAGGIAHTTAALISAEIDLSLTTVPMLGDGSSTCINGCAGYMSVCKQAAVTIEVLFDIARWTDFQASPAQTQKFLGFVQPTTNLDIPAWALYLPNCYLLKEPEVEPLKGDYLKAKLVYGAMSPGFSVTEINEDDPETSPWILGFSGEET